MNPSYDNTQDSADLEIARLKAELARVLQVLMENSTTDTRKLKEELVAERDQYRKECGYARPPIGSDVRTPAGEWLTVDQSKHVGKTLPDPGPPEWFRRLAEELESVKLERDCVHRENEEWRRASKDWAELHGVAELEAELEEARSEHEAYRTGAKREWQHQYDKRNRAESDAEALRAEHSRLTEESRTMRETLMAICNADPAEWMAIDPEWARRVAYTALATGDSE